MRTRHRLAALTAAAVVAGGCSFSADHSTPQTAGPSPTRTTPSAVPSPSVSWPVAGTKPATGPDVLAASGIGSYFLGTSLSGLQNRGLITNVAPSELCADTQHAEGTGRYAGQLTFTFTGAAGKERLIAIHTQNAALRSPTGARVGMAVDEVAALYGDRAERITNPQGSVAVIARVQPVGLAILLAADQAGATIATMSAGELPKLEAGFMAGEGC